MILFYQKIAPIQYHKKVKKNGVFKWTNLKWN